MLTPLMSFNLSEVRLKFNSRPSPHASQCVCSLWVGEEFQAEPRSFLSVWASLYSYLRDTRSCKQLNFSSRLLPGEMCHAVAALSLSVFL